VQRAHNSKREVKIAVVGKYFDSGSFVLSDVYISVLEALKNASHFQNLKPRITYLNSKDIESGTMPLSTLDNYDGVLIPGGFGETGIEGKIQVIQYVRENKIPYFGLCYGMQLAVIEYARNVAKLTGAHTQEVDHDAPHQVVAVMEGQKDMLAAKNYGGTMRLGAYPCELKAGTIAAVAYGKSKVSERHRHRFEVNPKYIKKLENAGLVFSGVSPSGILMEIAELPQNVHPFFLGTQFHPEFLSRPLSPHPLFVAFVKVAAQKKAASSR
jgi:CTP synthase